MAGRVAFVSGASRGMGFELAEELVRRGNRVYGAFRSKPKSKPGFETVKMDVTDDDSIKSAIDLVLQKEGRIDILVNNAGINIAGPVEETPVEEARRVFETNYFGLVKIIQAVVPSMRERGTGTIANVGSAAGKIAIPFQGHYSASKHALEALSESLWHELKGFGIRVLLFEPGDVSTDIWNNSEKRDTANSNYGKMLEKFYAVKQKEMSDARATAADKVGAEMADILLSNTKKLRHPVAHMAGVFLFIRKIAPDALFLPGVGKNYGIE